MREGINIEVNAADRERLATVVADRNSPQKHVWRAKIVLLTRTDSVAAFLALDSNQPTIQPMQRVSDRAAVPLPRPRPKRL